MSQWLSLLNTGQDLLNGGHPEKASELYREGLKTFARDDAAVAWLTFNLMLSESALHGHKAAQTYLTKVLTGSVGWNAKLYALERALSAANPGDDNLDALYREVLSAIERYVAATLSPDDINVNSSFTIARHLSRLFPEGGIDPKLRSTAKEDALPIVYTVASHPTPPAPMTRCNRRPHVLANAQDYNVSPSRPLGFRHVGPSFVIRLGNNTVLFSDEGRLLDTPYGAYPAFLRTILEKMFPALKSTRRLSGTSLFIGDYFSQALNYCHWLLDGMTRIVAATEADLRFDHAIGVWEETASFQTDSLKKLLAPGQTYVGFTASDGLVAVDDLYFANNFDLPHINHPVYGSDKALIANLRSRLMDEVVTEGKRRLYVPRRHNRVVLNEPALIDLLTAYGFESINTDAMSFQAQVETFAEAEAVVAPHGAALTNLLFAPPGTKVLELFPPFGGSMSFYRLSNGCELNYACYIDDVSQGPDRDAGGSVINNTAGIQVDLDFVARWLSETFGSPVTPL